ncbi:Glycoside hydrolase family 43 protein [Purpureocillium lavendulum]|uniref:Glycoside hydrolase family 43 protein n=1 Tax=Purpureocillium lavendulum TaxID=1247861 RepID=A0AB34FAF2_9HYPO|nr:Glycoside hydrolase family 43 protein [Purpureocillium lavendulum]
MANELLRVRDATPVGKLWAHRFVKRRPELQTRFSRKYDYQRAKCEDPAIIGPWFGLVRNTKTKYGIVDDDTYNFDETGFMMGVILAGMVVTTSDGRARAKLAQPGNREWSTVIQAVSALGWPVPPFIILAGQHHLANWYQECELPADWRIATTDNGWTTNEGPYRLLILDGHESHHSTEFELYCKEHNIITLCMPPHSSHILQPLDVGCFGPLKQAYGHQVEALMRMHITHVSKLEFLCAFRDAFFASMTEKNIQGGFAGAGLVPYDPQRVLSKLDVRLRTPTPPQTPIEIQLPWVSKTPQNAYEASSQSKHIKTRISTHQNSSPTSVLAAMDKFERGTTAMMHQVALLRAEVSSLRKANEGLSKRRRAKKTRIRLGGSLTIQDAQDLVDQKDLDEQIQKEERQSEQPEDIAEPARLVLQERLIVEGTSTAYRMDQSVTSPLKSSIVFERVQPETAPQHVFYLVHPPHAQYRTDKPAYYMTAVATPALGNMRLAPSKQHLQRPSFTGMLSPGRTSSHAPLFAAAEVEQRVNDSSMETSSTCLGAEPQVHPEAPKSFAPTLNDAPLLPTGFPDVLDSSTAWKATDFAEHSQFILRLKDVDIREAEKALEHFKALGLDGDLMSREAFPLPSLGPKLDGFRLNLHDGTGYEFRGLNSQKYVAEDLAILYLGIKCYIVNRRERQNAKNKMLVHIIADDSYDAGANYHRHSTAPITAHDEEGDNIITCATRGNASPRERYVIASADNGYTKPDASAGPRVRCRTVPSSTRQYNPMEASSSIEIERSIGVVSAQIGYGNHIPPGVAVHMWGDVGVTFRRIERSDGAHFRVVYRNSPLHGNMMTFATAFLPNYTADKRTLYVYALAFAETQIQHLANVLAHEVGHILGFRHEFAIEEEKLLHSVTLGSRNPNSIMCYHPDASRFKVTPQDRDEMKSFYGLSSANYAGLQVIEHIPDGPPPSAVEAEARA